MKVRILGLNDDIHQTFFIMQDNTNSFTANELINMLAKPHNNKFEIKTINVFDLKTEEEDTAFEILDAVNRKTMVISYEEYQELFNILWEVGSNDLLL